MSKSEFLTLLRKALNRLPQIDVEERLAFYSEMIDDRIEDGLTEEAAVAELGSVDNIASQIMSEIPLLTLVKENIKPNRTLRVWEIILLVLGSPIWLSLLLSIFIIILCAYTVIWSIVVTLWTILLSVAALLLSGILLCMLSFFQGNASLGFASIGVSLACCGIAIFVFLGCKQVTKAVLILTKKIFIRIKSCFIKKEDMK